MTTKHAPIQKEIKQHEDYLLKITNRIVNWLNVKVNQNDIAELVMLELINYPLPTKTTTSRTAAATPELLEAAIKATNLLQKIQEVEEGPMAMPWYEIEELAEAINKAKGE